ncbi:8296_t:CDS:2 [Acaulospora morrowiae]|uniref:8296_t:CDS:1 n=1 Tax=Acaulospora morrowiae TaxID=94023 RepID=A0A9N8ZV64_9GLOM|nr:8296_t:CDS:2 [Acaulospora morrowiae]
MSLDSPEHDTESTTQPVISPPLDSSNSQHASHADLSDVVQPPNINAASPEGLTNNEELPIPPDTTDTQTGGKVKWRRQDEEPTLYIDQFVAVTKTYLYIFNYYIPDGRDKAIPMNSITNVQTDKETNVSYQRWGAGSMDLWWARDFGRWKNHDLCVIVTVDKGFFKRKGFTMESIEGFHVLKRAWKQSKGMTLTDKDH